ncbi:CoA transferase [Rhodococcus sp. ZPP]|uniref:CaiB/BaiF CoA transferase family protein n=1 Tax=Rhodococcus sp. ZPP TaxID=2749906 RepID=UPI001AD86049|nr:CoA transferase [Rhodococcus sp. ZPP]QTJ67343.1 CoA transferase [Rhodococcus sp. ZPP]
MNPAPPAPLTGITVVDFTIMIAGPYGARLLADAGAEVIKVESPDGDPMRKRTPIRDGQSSYFGALNAGKKSVMLDLKQAGPRKQALDLIADADVVIENFRPGVMKRLGLDYETCAAVNPRLIYCSISGYGQTGPKSGHPAYAPILHAVSGYDTANMHYQRGADAPASTGTFVADVMAGHVAYGAILTGLIGRATHGRGDHVDVALLDTMLSTLVYETQAAQADGPKPGKTVYRPARAGEEFVIIAAITDRNFQALAEAMNRPELLADHRFSTMASREQHWEEWQDIIAGWVRGQNAVEVEKYLLARGVPCSRFRTIDEALRDEHLVARGSLRTARDAAGSFQYLGAPFQSHNVAKPDDVVAVAELGADNDTVLEGA